MEFNKRFTTHQIEALGNYVYVYYDLDSGAPFYIGRGIGNRVLSHMKQGHNEFVTKRLKDNNFGIDILAYGLDEETSKKVEAAAIDLVGIDNLLNKSRGYHAAKYGRIKLETLRRTLEAEPLTRVKHNLIAVSIKSTYEVYGDNEIALHESTRGVWANISQESAEAADYIVGIVGDRIAYVMTAVAYVKAGSMEYFVRDQDEVDCDDRIEFVGKTAPEEIQEIYLGKKLRATQRPSYYGPYWGKEILKEGKWVPADFD